MNDLDFDALEPIELPVKYKGKNYVLREATGEASVAYRNARLDCTQYNESGEISSIRGLASIEPLLVSLCLFKVNPAGSVEPVTVEELSSWPARVQDKLFAKAKLISGMSETDTDLDNLAKALRCPNSPVTIEELQAWAKTLDSSHSDFKDWISLYESPEQAKNSQSSMTIGSS